MRQEDALFLPQRPSPNNPIPTLETRAVAFRHSFLFQVPSYILKLDIIPWEEKIYAESNKMSPEN